MLVTLFISASSFAQSKEEQVLENVKLLNNTIFGSKDSAVIDGLLAKTLTYGHSGGSIENRETALKNASKNGNVYSKLEARDFSVDFADKNVAVVRFVTSFIQTTKGNDIPLTLHMLQVWKKESGKWKLTARQAVKLVH